MSEVKAKSVFTFEGLKPEDFKVDPSGNVTIDSKALGEALKNKLQAGSGSSSANAVFPEGGTSPQFVRVAVDVG